MSNSNSPPILLVTMAHPDDESFGIGGTLAYYARQGVQIHLVCLTGGEAGTVDAHFLEGVESIAQLRAGELRCAAETLGLASVEVGWYRDSGMPGSPDNAHPEALVNQPVEAVAERIALHIRKLRPHVVITHDPIGGYRHPDHIAVHQATLLAFQTAADPAAYPASNLPAHQAQKLYYNTFPKTLLRVAVFLIRLFGGNPRAFGRNKDIDLQALVEHADFPVHVRVKTTQVLPISEAASACHASQLPSGPRRGPVGWLLRLFGASDPYMRAYPEAPQGLKEKDLFDGVVL